jgi:DNA-binding Lrp family transcriptional regulator
MNSPEFRLLNDFQRDFPLCERPYRAIADRLGTGEAWVLTQLARLLQHGLVGRIGAVFAPNRIGTSTLAALAVPPEALERVAHAVSAFPEVNHNYERDHALNLWFVVTARDAAHLQRTLAAIEARAACGEVLSMPLVEEFRIDLGFDLRNGRASGAETPPDTPRRALNAGQQRLVAALQEGLMLVPRPYAALADFAGMSEDDVLATLGDWQHCGLIRRFGVVVRHRPLGFRANAMVVWDTPDALAGDFGRRLAAQPRVSLSYRRERCAPDWNYNLYCMLHGREAGDVLGEVRRIARSTGLDRHGSAVLFSRRCFKQTGARLVTPGAIAHA